MKFYVEKKVLVGFVIALISLLSLGYYSYYNNEDFIYTSKMVAHTNEVLYHLEKSQSVSFEMESLLLKHVISGDSSFKTSYVQEMKAGSQHVKKLQELLHDNPAQLRKLDSLRLLGREKVFYNQRVFEARKHSYEEAKKLIPSVENGKLHNKINFLLDEMKTIESDLLAERMEKNKKGQLKFYGAFSSMLVAIVLVLILVFLSINQNLNARIVTEQRARELNKELEAFTYSVSHDLRAPLRSIDGYAKILQDDFGDKLDSEGHRIIAVIMNNAKRMGHLIDDLLEFSRLGRKEITVTELNMQEMVEWVIRDLLENYQGQQPSIVIQSLLPCKGDHSMIRQVWINLISNAIKYSSKSPTPSIVIQSQQENGTIVYSVKDNGVGFDMTYSHKLFNVFQRLHKAKDFEGTGVGLALVKRIVTKHNGNVWAEAAVDKGATFYFSLNSKT